MNPVYSVLFTPVYNQETKPLYNCHPLDMRAGTEGAGGSGCPAFFRTSSKPQGRRQRGNCPLSVTSCPPLLSRYEDFRRQNSLPFREMWTAEYQEI
ncbi:hypothetical protein AVEN_52543-1 [Araneus ventricosus]|uniref:Uncharacterized protein n=1 Tax=Araneus ventricosus TaxID=182803 RepID=A0A4Y2KN59_ARAVE|nr:hypothetical protein AVEN_52543-1 [Araneus ventricosus]